MDLAKLFKVHMQNSSRTTHDFEKKILKTKNGGRTKNTLRTGFVILFILFPRG